VKLSTHLPLVMRVRVSGSVLLLSSYAFMVFTGANSSYVYGLEGECHAAQVESRGIALLILNLVARWRWVVNATPLPLLPQKRAPVPLVQKASWAPGPVRTPNHPARSESLQRLHYPCLHVK